MGEHADLITERRKKLLIQGSHIPAVGDLRESMPDDLYNGIRCRYGGRGCGLRRRFPVHGRAPPF